jgi:hypothetical protein
MLRTLRRARTIAFCALLGVGCSGAGLSSLSSALDHEPPAVVPCEQAADRARSSVPFQLTGCTFGDPVGGGVPVGSGLVLLSAPPASGPLYVQADGALGKAGDPAVKALQGKLPDTTIVLHPWRYDPPGWTIPILCLSTGALWLLLAIGLLLSSMKRTTESFMSS